MIFFSLIYYFVSLCFQLHAYLTDIQKSINAIDCDGSRVICGCNNEAVYLINNI